MKGTRRFSAKRIWLIAALLVAINLIYYLTLGPRTVFHELLDRLYYLPVILGGFWFGVKGGLFVSLLASACYIPNLYLAWAGERIILWNGFFEVIFFNIAGLTVGFLAEREQRQRSRNQELQTLATLGEAAVSVAHEMKNVIIPIRGFIRRIRETCAIEEKGASYLDIVEREAIRLEQMTKDMLLFARQVPLTKEKIDVSTFLVETCASLEGEFQAKRVMISHHCNPEELFATMDRHKMHQAMINLLQNALQASPPGGEVWLTAERSQQFLHLTIADNGIGIPAEHLERIFLPFFTTRAHGTGLGLAIVRRIVNEHGGRISAESVTGKGTTFHIEIPIALVEP